ncbi:hypothetical protein SAY87_015350 [Trapa incisa]|uniref:Myb-like domain-containing protein n=1 Tax=Trapa incisa TaxID=236973 RepID=A0AAN7JKX5_9MYRT|nr:hypothetical protein SAY87_015350 [Trapa incisa]
MQQGVGGGGGGGSNTQQYFMGGVDQSGQQSSSQMEVEEASPISSRPPASSAVNLDEFMSGSGGRGFPDMEALATAAAGDDAERGGAGGSGGGNRWPRQETLALLKIRSEMDATFRDATVKGPLWEDVSRKLAELGYKRSAKKCKEKFENVDKYYKRTKEGRAGRQDGKTYKFFSELEALHNTAISQAAAAAPPTMATAAPPGISFSSPMPISSIRPLVPTTSISMAPLPPQAHLFPRVAQPPMGLDFSSDSSSSSHETEGGDGDENEGSEPSNVGGSGRKRKRGSRRMMEFFEGLMKQVIQKQEAMQQKFLEAIEKREEERSIREEAWRRQEMALLAREHEIMAQERTVSASRNALIMSFLQKITGQPIHLATPPPPPPPQPAHVPVQLSPQQQQPGNFEPTARHMDVVLAAVPEQQVRAQEGIGGGEGEGGSGSRERPPQSSSRWPKTEVIALIKLRSGLEPRYQEAGPKGPLWEEISAGMQRMGYSRSAKRCKEKWENINKYFKKVKESNKKRPEDAKTCPYFHELDALYRKKILTSSSFGSIGGGSEGAGSSDHQVQHHTVGEDAGKDGHKEEGNGDASKPEDTVIGGNPNHHRRNPLDLQLQQQVSLFSGEADKNGIELQHRDMGMGLDNDDDEDTLDEDEDYDDEEGEDDEEERKMGYKIEFHHQEGTRQNPVAGPPSGGGAGSSGGGSGAATAAAAAAPTTSFTAMVQ